MQIGCRSATWLKEPGRKEQPRRPSASRALERFQDVRCEQARQLFDAYLDGELSSALETELGAHRVRCASCRREIALLEVSGHVLRTDLDDSTLSGDFTDRLLRCVEEAKPPLRLRLRRVVYVAAPLAAAAVIAMAFFGAFDGKSASRVAGLQEVNPHLSRSDLPEPPREIAPAAAPVAPVPELAFEEWLRQAGANVEAGRRTGESLHQMLDDTFQSVLILLEDAAYEMGPPAPQDSPSNGGHKSDVEDM